MTQDNNWVQQQRRADGRQRVFEALAEFIEENGHAPTRNELATITGMAVITVRRHMKDLVDEGRIIEGRGHRTARIVE